MWGKKMVEGKATIIADEGLTGLRVSTPDIAWVHCKYIVEVRPEVGEAFRTETTAKVEYLGGPSEGDVVNCRYDPESHKVDLQLEGDPRYDPALKRAAAEAKREALLRRTPGAAPVTPAATYTQLDPELQALMDAEEAERLDATWVPPQRPSGNASASRLDQLQQLGELHKQGVLSDAEFKREKARILSEQ